MIKKTSTPILIFAFNFTPFYPQKLSYAGSQWPSNIYKKVIHYLLYFSHCFSHIDLFITTVESLTEYSVSCDFVNSSICGYLDQSLYPDNRWQFMQHENGGSLANTTCWLNGGVMLDQSRKWWADIGPGLGQLVVFAGISHDYLIHHNIITWTYVYYIGQSIRSLLDLKLFLFFRIVGIRPEYAPSNKRER